MTPEEAGAAAQSIQNGHPNGGIYNNDTLIHNADVFNSYALTTAENFGILAYNTVKDMTLAEWLVTLGTIGTEIATLGPAGPVVGAATFGGILLSDIVAEDKALMKRSGYTLTGGAATN